MSILDGDLRRLIRWYDVVSLGGSILVVTLVFIILDKSSPPELVNAIGIALIIFGFVHLLVGLFGDPVSQLRQWSLEHTASLALVQ